MKSFKVIGVIVVLAAAGVVALSLLGPKQEQEPPSPQVTQADSPSPDPAKPAEIAPVPTLAVVPTATATASVSEETPERPAVAGYVIDMSGQPVPGVIIAASGVESTVRSDTDGHFAFGAVEGGTATLRVDHTPYLPLTLKGLDLPTEDAVFVLSGGGQIRGRVTDRLSRAVEGVTIEMNCVGGPKRKHSSIVKIAAASSPSEAPWRAVLEKLDEESIAGVCELPPYKIETAVSGPDGHYVLSRLRSGKYAVRIKHDALAAQPHKEVLVPWEGTVEGIDFTVGSGFYIRGRAYEERSGAAVASVTVSHRLTRREAVTQDDGTYELGPVPPGSYHLRVRPPSGYVVAVLPLGREGPEVNVTDQDIEGVDIKLEKAGVIRGQVVNSNGQPVPNAGVSLAFQSFNPMEMQRAIRIGAASRGKKTDEQGRFELDRIPEDNGYVLHAGANGYAPGRFGPFDLGYGEMKEGIEIVLTGGGSISGRIATKDGEPIPDHTVYCVPGDNFFAILPLLMADNKDVRKSATTADDGTYRIEGVPEGKNFVMVYRGDIERSGGMPKAQRTVDMSPGEEKTGVDFTIDVAKLDGMISGRVTTSKGQPAGNAFVMAMCKNMMMVNQEGGRAETGSEEDGTYTLKDLLVGVEYNVFAGDRETIGNDPGAIFANSVLQTAKTPAENVDFVLPGKGGLSGRVVYKLTGRPAPAFSILANRIKGEEDPFGGMTALIQGMFGGGGGRKFSSLDGSFVLEDLVAGTYNLQVSGEGFTATTLEGISVFEDRTIEDVVIEVEGGGGIEGIVQDAVSKMPIEGARVTVQPGGAAAMFSLLGMDMAQPDTIEVMTGPDGKFSITGLDEGSVTLNVAHEDYAPQTVGSVSLPSQGMQTIEIALLSGGRIQGHAYDAKGDPMRGRQLTIFAMDASGTFPVTTDDEGFYWKDAVPEGHYIVGFSMMDILGSEVKGSLQGRGEVRNGETTIVDIGGQGGATVVGTVRRGGQPVPDVEILFIKGAEANAFLPGGMLTRVSTDSDGSYRAPGLPGGSAKLFVTRMGNIFQGQFPQTLHRREIQIPESGEIRADIDLQLSALGGWVRDAETGEPVDNAFVMLLLDLSGSDRRPYELRPGADGGMGANQTQTSSDGRYQFDDVDPGQYVLTCRAEGYGQQAVEVTVGAAPGGDVDFALPKDVGEIVGQVTARDTGRAVPGGMVFLIDQHGQMIMPAGTGPVGMFVDQSGRFRIDSVAPGAYALLCGDPMGGAYAWNRIDGVVVQAGQTTELDVQLDRGATVVLRLVDPQGQPLLGAQWKLYDSRGMSMSGQMLEIGNTMRVSLTPGQYTAQPELAGFQPTQFPFVIEEGQTTFEAPVVTQPM